MIVIHLLTLAVAGIALGLTSIVAFVDMFGSDEQSSAKAQIDLARSCPTCCKANRKETTCFAFGFWREWRAGLRLGSP